MILIEFIWFANSNGEKTASIDLDNYAVAILDEKKAYLNRERIVIRYPINENMTSDKHDKIRKR